VARLDETGWEVFDTRRSGLPSNWIWSLAEDHSGNMWIGTADGGLAVYRQGGVINECGMKGDVTDDNTINILDVVTAVRIYLGLSEGEPCNLWRGDCNGDGELNIIDILGIVNAITGLGNCQP
jgi:hypothetical protein